MTRSAPSILTARTGSSAFTVKKHGIRVVPNDFHPEVPHQRTIEQISGALNVLGRFAAGYGQRIRLENHGTAGDLVTLKKVMEGVDQKNVGIKLNGEAVDAGLHRAVRGREEVSRRYATFS